MAKKKGILSTIFGGSKKKTSSTTKRASKPKKTAARSSKPKKANGATPKRSTAQAKPKTKKPTSKATSGVRKKYEKPLVLVPVEIKDYRDKKGGHPHVIVDDIADKHISVGLTKDKYKGRNATNYKCEVSPLGKNVQSYMRRQAQVKPKKDYYNFRNGKMDLEDYNRAQVYANRAKEKYLREKEQKNSNEVPNA